MNITQNFNRGKIFHFILAGVSGQIFGTHRQLILHRFGDTKLSFLECFRVLGVIIG